METNRMITIFLIIIFAIGFPALAQSALDLGLNYAKNIGLPGGNPIIAATNLIKLLMTFIGLLAVIMILYGGFIWMTSAGDEDRAKTAKKIISSSIIGLIIILASFLIVNFVVQDVSNALSQ